MEVHGLENVPKTGAVLFLPNHQKALIDVLLIVTDCHRKPYFLTRSDVFNKQVLRRFFAFSTNDSDIQMRDGRNQLKNNEAVFKKCTELFENEEAIVLFPEANHNLRRRVRNLSKGFTRIVIPFIKAEPVK
ncbi:1-acyl-sn-glycerol-3-phosphate acyltransferase [Winogradskyella maritima]|nr:1-acyl-sn-glycerol-3-phosphate acyltransferase [Winogradskyella maritima]